MAHAFNDLETNPFFKALQARYFQKFKEAQKKLWLICVPYHNSLNGFVISQDFVDFHILKPSPFFKGHFVSTDNRNSITVEIQDGEVISPSGVIKVLMEEIGYNDEFKPYRILIIERPLSSPTKDPLSMDEARLSLKTAGDFLLLSLNEFSTILRPMVDFSRMIVALDMSISAFNTSYMILPEYLPDAALKLQSISRPAVEELIKMLEEISCDAYTVAEMSRIVHNYVLDHVHHKVFPAIKTYCFEEDNLLTQKLLSLYEGNITPDQLGVKEAFCCPTPRAVVELASLNSRTFPFLKMNCLMATLELLNKDIEQFLLETYHPVSNKDIPTLTSDDLIPLLASVIVQARPQYLAANLYYIQNFCWEIPSVDKYSFGLVTFQAAKEFLRSGEFGCLQPSRIKIKKELSLEELMEVTAEMQSSSKSAVGGKPAQCQSPIDHQLENATKMIEASTMESDEGTRTEEPSSPLLSELLLAFARSTSQGPVHTRGCARRENREESRDTGDVKNFKIKEEENVG